MRYEYVITDHEEKKEVVKAMSWKKMLKNLLIITFLIFLLNWLIIWDIFPRSDTL